MERHVVADFKASMKINPILLFLKSVLAGIFIGLAVAASQCAAASVQRGAALAAAVFPIGLILVSYCGGKLFTGEAFKMSLAMLLGLKVKGVKEYFRAAFTFLLYLAIIFFGNLFGSVMISDLLARSLPETALTLIQFAVIKKSEYGFDHLAASAMLCNVLVALAVYPAPYEDTNTKFFITWFCVFAFVICGLEHSVANMSYEFINYFATGELVQTHFFTAALFNFIGASSFALLVSYVNKERN